MVIFCTYGSEIRWVGNETAVTGIPCLNRYDYTDQREFYDKKSDCKPLDNNHGFTDGLVYSIAECDISITSEWFWKQGKVQKSIKEL